MAHSVLEAVKLGIWDYELDDDSPVDFQATDAIPGSTEKLDIMAQRVRLGLPLWHPSDRRDYERSPERSGLREG